MQDKQRAYDETKDYKGIVRKMIKHLERVPLKNGGARVYIRGHWKDKEGKGVHYAYKTNLGFISDCQGFTTVKIRVNELHDSGYVHENGEVWIESWSYLDEHDRLNRAYGQYIALRRALDVLYSHVSVDENIAMFAPENVLVNPPKITPSKPKRKSKARKQRVIKEVK